MKNIVTLSSVLVYPPLWRNERNHGADAYFGQVSYVPKTEIEMLQTTGTSRKFADMPTAICVAACLQTRSSGHWIDKPAAGVRIRTTSSVRDEDKAVAPLWTYRTGCPLMAFHSGKPAARRPKQSHRKQR